MRALHVWTAFTYGTARLIIGKMSKLKVFPGFNYITPFFSNSCVRAHATTLRLPIGHLSGNDGLAQGPDPSTDRARTEQPSRGDYNRLQAETGSRKTQLEPENQDRAAENRAEVALQHS